MPETVKKKADYPAPPPLGELTTTIHINVDEIPDHVRDDLAATTLGFIHRLLNNPETRAKLEARMKAKRAALYSQGK